MSVIPDALFHRGGVPVDSITALGMGNVYWVIGTSHAQYATFMRDRQGMYENDKSEIVHSTIASALTASVTKRNDYIVVMPDSNFYSDDETLTMNKDDVHLISPSHMGTGMASFRSVVQCTGAYAVITITGNGIEVAGLFFTPLSGYNIMDFSDGTVWSPYIHDNYFGMYAEADDDDYGIISTGAVNSCCIRDNTFTNFSAIPATGTNDIAAFIALPSACTRGLIKNNFLHTGANTLVASGIQALGAYPMIIGNYLGENAAHGAAEAGTFTIGIEAMPSATIIDNRIGITDTSKAIVMQDNTATPITCINNISSLDGGTITM